MPWILPAIAIAATAASTTMSIMGSIEEGDANAASSMFQAGQAERAAKVSERNAALARDSAREAENRTLRDARRTLGDIRAAYGASGVTTDGTPQEYMESQWLNAQRNILQIRYEGELKAQSFLEESGNYLEQRDQFKKAAQYGQSIGTLNAIGAGLKGAGRIADMAYSLT